jgi:hypothetical protein
MSGVVDRVKLSRNRGLSVKRRLVPLLAVLVPLGGLAALSSSCVLTVGTTPITNCTSTSGVIVAVDFSHWTAGLVDRGCDPTPTTGYAALHAAGFTTAGDKQDGSAFICRINGDPTVAQDACTKTPPPSAFWSYWHANPGKNTWTLSSLGATSYRPKPGSVDAWAFGAEKPPSFTPAQVRN